MFVIEQIICVSIATHQKKLVPLALRSTICNRALGGSDTEENLALACNRCNQNRYNFVVGRDLETSTILPLFNPRNQLWQEHFTWSLDATRVIGTTAIGRATCDRLDMNDEKYKGERSIREARALWLEAGWHPPANDPRQLEV